METLDVETTVAVRPPPTGSQTKSEYAASLWNRMTATETTRERAVDAVDLLTRIKELESVKETVSFSQVENIRMVIDQCVWEDAGYKNFHELVTSPDRPCSKSAGYRYKAVAEFSETFPLDDREFNKGFRERWGIETVLSPPRDGLTAEQATAEDNLLTVKARFTQVARIATLFNKGTIGHAESEELLSKSLLLDEKGFDAEVKELTGNKKESVTDELRSRGIFGACILVPLAETSVVKARLAELLERISGGEDFAAAVAAEESVVLGSKSVKFHAVGEGDEEVVLAVA